MGCRWGKKQENPGPPVQENPHVEQFNADEGQANLEEENRRLKTTIIRLHRQLAALSQKR